MKNQTKKWVLAGAVALSSAAGDAASQLVSGQINWTRVMLFGLALGVVTRAVGAALAALAVQEIVGESLVVTTTVTPSAPDVTTTVTSAPPESAG